MIHAFERFLENYHTGEYNRPEIIGILSKEYYRLVESCHDAGNYWDESYFEGYLNGIIFIGTCENNLESIKSFPFFFLPNVRKELATIDILQKELDRVSTQRSKYHRFAKKIVDEKCGADLVIHHPPF